MYESYGAITIFSCLKENQLWSLLERFWSSTLWNNGNTQTSERVKTLRKLLESDKPLNNLSYKERSAEPMVVGKFFSVFSVCLSPLKIEIEISPTFPFTISSVSQSCLTLCDPMNRSTPGLPVYHQPPESTQTHVHWVSDAIQPSHPLSSPSPPALNLSQHQGLFTWVSSSHQVAKISESQLQHQSFQWTRRTDFL